MTLSIARAGRVVLSRRIGSAFGYARIPVGAFYRHDRSLAVRDLDGDGRLEVVVKFFSGGAHCCSWSRVFFRSGPGYRSVAGDFLDAGYVLKDAGGSRAPEFVSADARFAYAFASFAESGFPVRVLRFGHGRFHDATGEFPALIRSDAQRYLRAVHRAEQNPDAAVGGLLAAYAADEVRLGRATTARSEIRRVRAEGRVPKTYERDVFRLLRRLGYPTG